MPPDVSVKKYRTKGSDNGNLSQRVKELQKWHQRYTNQKRRSKMTAHSASAFSLVVFMFLLLKSLSSFLFLYSSASFYSLANKFNTFSTNWCLVNSKQRSFHSQEWWMDPGKYQLHRILQSQLQSRELGTPSSSAAEESTCKYWATPVLHILLGDFYWKYYDILSSEASLFHTRR